MKKPVELVQGTLDMLILKAVSLGGLHGYGVLLRLQQLTGGQLQIQQGSLYPALYRLEHQGLIASEWGESDNKRKAKFYTVRRGDAIGSIATMWNTTTDRLRNWNKLSNNNIRIGQVLLVRPAL